MRSLRLCCLLAVLTACSEKPADSAAADSAATAASMPAAPSLASYAGTWNMRTMGAASDSVLLEFTMTATADSTGWVYNFPNSATPVPVRIVSFENGTLVTEAGPYDSNLRPGTKVTTRSTARMVGDTMLSDIVATYAMASGDSVLNLRTTGTRAP